MIPEGQFETDVAIIGAGPVGLFTVFQCGMLGLKSHVIDSLEDIGGQCSALYPEKPIYDIPSHPEILAGDLIENLQKQAAPFNPIYHLSQQVVSMSQDNGLWILKTSTNNEISAKAVIIAGGAGAFGPNKPPLEKLEQYEGTSIFYMVREKKAFEGQDIVIGGGGDSAVDWAIALAPIAKSVTVVHRRDKFRAAPDNVKKMHNMAEQGLINMAVPYQLSDLKGDGNKLSSVIVKGKEGEKTLKADALLLFYGLSMDLGPINDWSLDIEGGQIKVDPSTSQTNQDTIYAVGDIAAYKNKLKLILTGFSESAMAAHDIRRKLYPDEVMHFEYSTTKGVPGAD